MSYYKLGIGKAPVFWERTSGHLVAMECDLLRKKLASVDIPARLSPVSLGCFATIERKDAPRFSKSVNLGELYT